MQDVPGVIDIQLTELKEGSTDILATYVPAPGHAKLDAASSFTYQTDLIT